MDGGRVQAYINILGLIGDEVSKLQATSLVTWNFALASILTYLKAKISSANLKKWRNIWKILNYTPIHRHMFKRKLAASIDKLIIYKQKWY